MITLEELKQHWKNQGGKLRGYELRDVEEYRYDGVIWVSFDGPKGMTQDDAYNKIKHLFSKSEFAGGAGYVGVGNWGNLRPNVFVNVPLDAELIDIQIRRKQ